MEASVKATESFMRATGFSTSDLATLIAAFVASAVFIWSAWVTMSHYEQWAQKRNNVTIFDVMWGATRSIVILSLILFIVT